MLRATLLMLCFAVAAQVQCLAECLALPCEDTHAIHQGAEDPGNCHDEGHSGRAGGSGSNPLVPEPSENEDCGNHTSWTMVSASSFEKTTAKTSMFAASLEGLPIETDIPSHGVLREDSMSPVNPLLPYVRSTVLLI